MEKGPVLVKSTYLLAFILLVAWVLAYLVFHVGPAAHLLLLAAMLSVLVNIIREG